jgi:hypothetical protein
LSRTSALVREQAGRRGRLEVGVMMQLPQVFLAVMCVLLGVMPALAFQLMGGAMSASRQGYGIALANAAPMINGPLRGLEELNGAALFAPLALAAVLALMFVVVRAISKLGAAKRRADVPWLCGYAREAECHRYVAHNFYGEIKRYFRWLGGAPKPQPGKQPALKET